MPRMRLKQIFHLNIKLPRCLTMLGSPSSVTVLDLVVVSIFLLLNVLMVWSRTDRSLGRGARKLNFLYEDSRDTIPGLSWGCAEILAKTFGIVAIVNIGWYLLLPIG